MRKLIAALITAALCVSLFTGCAARPAANTASARQNSAESSQPTAEGTAQTAQSQASTGTPPEESSSPARVSVETFESEDGMAKVEYLVIDGLADAALQDTVNELLASFYLWQWQVVVPNEEEEPDPTTYNGKAAYAVVGPYLSVTRTLDYMGSEAAHPRTEISSAIIDLTTAEFAIVLLDGAAVKAAVLDGRFRQTSPGGVENAAERFAEKVSDSFEMCSYLTETGVALYSNDQIHAEGDYWVFEANYADVPEILCETLKTAVLP